MQSTLAYPSLSDGILFNWHFGPYTKNCVWDMSPLIPTLANRPSVLRTGRGSEKRGLTELAKDVRYLELSYRYVLSFRKMFVVGKEKGRVLLYMFTIVWLEKNCLCSWLDATIDHIRNADEIRRHEIWITSTLLEGWITKCDLNHKVALIRSSNQTHIFEKRRTSLFPPNTTSKTQPTKQIMIKTLELFSVFPIRSLEIFIPQGKIGVPS